MNLIPFLAKAKAQTLVWQRSADLSQVADALAQYVRQRRCADLPLAQQFIIRDIAETAVELAESELHSEGE